MTKTKKASRPPPLPAEFTQLLGEWCQASDAHGLIDHQWKTIAIANATARAHSTQVSQDAHSNEQTLRMEAQAKNRDVQQVQNQIEEWIKNAEGDKKAYAEILEFTDKFAVLSYYLVAYRHLKTNSISN
jgi:hypothetical protein